jgi:ketosteroid isomerase-like protein
MNADEAIIRETYDAFNARDIEGALRYLHDDVSWADGEGGMLKGKSDVRKHWLEQWKDADPRVEITKSTRASDGVVLSVRLRARAPNGAITQNDLENVIRIENGRIREMRIPNANVS